MYDYYEINLKKIEDYFVKGIKKQDSEFYIGLELEHFIVNMHEKRISFYEEKGIEYILNQIKDSFDNVIYSENHIIGLVRNDFTVTLEPAGQIEVSIAKKSSIKQIKFIYKLFTDIIEPVLKSLNYKLVTYGYMKKDKAENMPLIPKKRYEYMDMYFKKSGNMGINMMRGTASTQISIDYFSESDFSAKYKAAYRLEPFVGLLTDNSDIFELEKYKKHYLRGLIWENVDNERVDILKYLKNGEMTFSGYAEFVYNTPLIFYLKNGEFVKTDKPASYIYKNTEVNNEDIEHFLSMVFPNVRLKNYIEIRYADSMPLESVFKYCEFIKGLFLKCDKLNDLFDYYEIGMSDINKIRKEIRENGYNSYFKDIRIKEITDKLLYLSKLKEMELKK